MIRTSRSLNRMSNSIELLLASHLSALDSDTIAAVLISTDGVLTVEALECLVSMHADMATRPKMFDDRVEHIDRLTGQSDLNAVPPKFLIVTPESAQRVHEIQQGQVLCFLPGTADTSLDVRASSSSFATWPASASGLIPSSVSIDDSTSTMHFVCQSGGLLLADNPGAFTVTTADGQFSFFCTSISYRAARALDQLFDCFFWGWTNDSRCEQDNAVHGWTSRLEFALVELLVSTEEVLLPMFESMSRMMPQEASEMSELATVLRKSLREALDERDAHAIGTIHQTLHQILEMEPDSSTGLSISMGLVPPQFATVIREFEKAKAASLSEAAFQALRLCLHETLTALTRYRHSLVTVEQQRQAEYGIQYQQYQQQIMQRQMMMAYQFQPMPVAPVVPQSLQTDINALQTSCANLQRILEQISSAPNHSSVDVEWSLLSKLKAKKLSDMFAMIMNSNSEPVLNPSILAPLPSIPMVFVGESDYRILDRFVDCCVQNCVGGAVLLGSVLGFKLDMNTPPEHGAIIIRNLLRAGSGFVGSGGRVIALLNMRRASLPLDHIPVADARKFSVRCKDLSRILRMKLKSSIAGLPDSTLSLRLNTDFDTVLQKVHEHHAPSWVSPALERVWRYMFERGEMITCELWLRTWQHTAPADLNQAQAEVGSSTMQHKDELVAADVGFATGHCFYVATRFSSRAHKTLAPGFVLAFAMARILQHAGYRLWDLGGTDSSPMMAYKQEIAIESFRPQALQRFREIRALPGAPNALLLRTEVISALSAEHLLNIEAISEVAAPKGKTAKKSSKK